MKTVVLTKYDSAANLIYTLMGAVSCKILAVCIDLMQLHWQNTLVNQPLPVLTQFSFQFGLLGTIGATFMLIACFMLSCSKNEKHSELSVYLLPCSLVFLFGNLLITILGLVFPAFTITYSLGV